MMKTCLEGSIRKLILFALFLIVFAINVSAVNNTFFDNQTFDDAGWCAASDWVLGSCDCNEGVLDCDEGEAAYFDYAIPKASSATNITCEANLKQNQGYSDNLYLWVFDSTNGLDVGGYSTAITRTSAEQGVFYGYDGTTEYSNFDWDMPFAELNVKQTFYSNGTFGLSINGTQVAYIYHTTITDTLYFQSQRTLNRNEDTELDNFVCYNGTYYDVSEEVDTTPPIVNTSINNTAPKINQVVNISANITDETELSFCQVIINQTGSKEYFNYSLSGTDDKCSKAITVTVSGGNVINFTIRVNDTSNNWRTNDTIITVIPLAPVVTIGYPSNGDKIDNVTYPLLINGTVTVTGGVANYTWINNTNWKNTNNNYANFNFTMNGTVTDGLTYYIMVLANNSEGVTRNNTVYFTVDFTAPSAASSLDSNHTLFNIFQNITFQINFTDNVQLYSFNISTPEGYLYNITGLNTLKYLYNGSINTSTYGVGRHNITAEFCDAHSALKIPDYETDRDRANLKLTYTTLEKDNIGIKLKSSDLYPADFGTYKKTDRYVFWFDFGDEDGSWHTYTFKVDNKYQLDYLINSIYKGHFVTKFNWIDFEFRGNEDAVYSVKKTKDNKYEVTIITKRTRLLFESVGNLNCNKKTWEYYLFNYTVTYSSIVVATVAENFKLVIDFGDIVLDGNGTITYNSTTYTVTNVSSSNQLNLTINIIPPQKTAIETNITFYWNFTLNTSNFFTINYTQLLQSIRLTFHGNLSNASALNFTLYDETNNSIINGNIKGTFNYDSSTFSPTLTNTNNLTIAIFPPSVSLSGDYVVYYSGTGYPERRYTESNAVYNNNTQVIKLYLLKIAEGGYATFRIIDSYQNPISDVKCTMKKIIGGSLVTVEKQTTDTSGLATFWVDPDDDYSFTFAKTGYVAFSATIRPITTEIYTITLEAEAEEEVLPYSTAITYQFSPSNIVLNNNTNYNFTFNLTSDYWEITDCTLYLKNASVTLTQSSSSYNASRCDIRIEYSTGNQTIIISEAVYQLNSPINETVSVQYKVQYTYEGEFSLKNFIDDLTAFAGAGFNDFTRMIIALIIIFSIVAYASSQITTLREPETLIILTWALVLCFSYIGWLTLNYEAIPEIKGLATGWLKQYIIFILITLGGGAYIIKRHL